MALCLKYLLFAACSSFTAVLHQNLDDVMATTANEDELRLRQPLLRYGLPYSPLQDDSFRLFELYPGKGSDAIRGRLVDANLNSPPRYEAISYHWGDKEQRRIEVDRSALLTTRSTVRALKQVRKQDESRLVWIDAVCINQRDLLERGHQVKLMGKIFSSAEQVLICILVPAASELRQLLENIHAVFEPVENIPNYPTPLRKFFAKFPMDLSSDLFDVLIGQLGRFMENPWFSRVWVLQEVGLSRSARLYCNDWNISWEKFIFAVTFFKSKSVLVKNKNQLPSWKVHPLSKKFWSPKAQKDFWIVLLDTLDHHATDPRDKFFALLSHPSALTSGDLNTMVQPDYQKSPEQISFEVMCSLMNQQHPLRVLSSVYHDQDCPTRDMSWIPRWRKLRPYPFGKDKRFQCAGPLAYFKIHDDHKTLEAQGILLHRIAYISKVMQRGDFKSTQDSQNPISAIWNELQEPEDGRRRYPRSESSFLEAYLQTLTADSCLWHWGGCTNLLVPDGDLNQSFRQALSSFEEIGVKDCLKTISPPLEDLSDREKAVLFFMEQASAVCGFRRFFKTSGRFYGLAPCAAKEGDLICILFGSTVPFVLRLDDASGKWGLVGECYVHGFMYGEGIEMWKERLFQDQTFRFLG